MEATRGTSAGGSRAGSQAAVLLAEPPFRAILIANRGEIAVRIIRAAKELGCRAIAVYSDADRDARHVMLADEAYYLGPAAPALSYLSVERLLEAARRSGADALHPGYGFFAENAGFARAVIAAGLTWIGPHPAAIDAMGDKVRARRAMRAAGIAVVPGGSAPLEDVAAARAAALEFGLPLALKASGGGGGKGLKIARTLDEVEAAFSTAQREAQAYFGDSTIYAERYLDNPKHIELQILADKAGAVLHVGERDCSLQRRHQKVWEETPPAIPAGVRDRLRAAGINAARAIAYDSVGTIECLVTGDDFYFLEMNTRIQVEHTISEQVSGIDLVREQILVAAGRPLPFGQADIVLRGHAIEVRINAEDPAQQFRPAPGTIADYREPGGFGVRVDSAAFAGCTIAPDYDSLIAKLIVWGRDRLEALQRLGRALDEFRITGVPTTLELLRALVDLDVVRSATYGTATLEPFAAGRTFEPAGVITAPGIAPDVDDTLRVEVDGKLFRIRFVDAPMRAGQTSGAAVRAPVAKAPRKSASGEADNGNEIVSPMHGLVVDVPVRAGDTVAQGDVVIIIEAMKMMNEIRAHRSGTIAAIFADRGATVEARTPLVRLA